MTLDTTPLTAPVDPAELQEFTRRNPTRTGPARANGLVNEWKEIDRKTRPFNAPTRCSRDPKCGLSRPQAARRVPRTRR